MTRIRGVLTVAGAVVIGAICLSLSRRTRPSPRRPPALYVIDGRRAHRDRVELGILDDLHSYRPPATHHLRRYGDPPTR